jgi:hypothetical protein
MVEQTAAHAVVLLVPKAAVQYPKVWEEEDAAERWPSGEGGGGAAEGAGGRLAGRSSLPLWPQRKEEAAAPVRTVIKCTLKLPARSAALANPNCPPQPFVVKPAQP